MNSSSAMAQVEEPDYVHYGTPIVDEGEGGPVGRKAPLDPAATRAAPVWQQEPTDEQGRKVCAAPAVRMQVPVIRP
jgi:hypothetical protein